MTDDRNGPRNPHRPGQDDEAKRTARESMLARQKLIEAMIDNNMRQLRFDSAFGGADIERAWALRELAGDSSNQSLIEQLAEIELRLERLGEDQARLVAEREWLNKALLEFDDQAAASRGENRGRMS